VIRLDKDVTDPRLVKALAHPLRVRILAVLDEHVASPTELLETARDMGVRLVPCQMTMDLLGLTGDDLIQGLEDPAGATSALLEAKDAVTLFI